METLELEPQIEATEKILVFSDDQQIALIRQEIESRCSILNKLTEFGLILDEIKTVTQSLADIDKFIHKRAIENNTKLKELVEAGIKAQYTLSPELESLSYTLKAWYNYRVPDNRMGKFHCLIFADTWVINEIALENYLIGSKCKVYLEIEEQIREYNVLLSLCEYFSAHKMENSQVIAIKFLRVRIKPVGMHKFIPRWEYLKGAQ